MFFIKENQKMHMIPRDISLPLFKADKEKDIEKRSKCERTKEKSKAFDGSVELSASGARIHCLTVIGQIEGHYMLGEREKATKYEHVIPLLASIDESDEIDGLLIILNTMGGDVEAGLAISEMIASMKKPTVSLVLGGGHSIGVPLAVAANRSFIVPSATMTVHPVRISGTVIGSRQTYNYLRDMQARIVKFIVSHSRVSEQALTELMTRPDEMATDIGTILNGDEAVRVGLIDRMGGLSDAVAELKTLIGHGGKL